MMKFDILNQLLNRVKQSFKHDSPESRDNQEYQKVKKEVRPLKAKAKYKPENGTNRDISAI